MAGDIEKRTVNIGLVQLRCTPDPEENTRRAIAGVREAAARGAQVICLPELFRSLYFCQTAYAAESEQAALENDTADPGDLEEGCNGFGWSELTAQ